MKGPSAILFMTLVFAFACEDSVGPSKKTSVQYFHSLEKWSTLKKSLGNSYEYEVVTTSWIGNNTSTEIKVVNDVVTSRSFESFRYVNGSLEVLDSYSESGAELGQHELGSPVATVDQLYGVCAQDYLMVNSEQNEISFSVGKNGVMETCGYAPKGCVDDCFVGVYINAIDWQ